MSLNNTIDLAGNRRQRGGDWAGSFQNIGEANDWLMMNREEVFAGLRCTIAGAQYTYGGAGVGWKKDWSEYRSNTLKLLDSPIVAFIGDSITVGVGGLVPVIQNSWVDKLATLLSDSKIDRLSMVACNSANGRWSTTGTWSTQPYGFGIGSCYYNTGAGTGVLTFSPYSPIQAYDTIQLMIFCGVGFGTMTITPTDGSTPVVVDTSMYPTGIHLIDVKLATPSINAGVSIERTAGGNVWVSAGGVRNSASRATRFANIGVGGQRAYGQWDKAGDYFSLSAIKSLAPARSIIMLGRNDTLQGVSIANYKTALSAIAYAASVSGEVFISSYSPSSEATGVANDAAFRDAMKDVCSAGGYTYIPLSESVFPNGFDPALMGSPYHPNDAGYTAMASFFANWWRE